MGYNGAGIDGGHADGRGKRDAGRRERTARALEEDPPMAEANAVCGGTGVSAPTAAKTTVAKARAARVSEKDTPVAEASALRGGTEEHVPGGRSQRVASGKETFL